MNLHQNSLLATFKKVADFGKKYAADFPADSVGGQQFAIVAAAVPQTGDLAAQQTSAGNQLQAVVKTKATTYVLLHDDLLAINKAAHTLVLLGTPGLDGKFHMPRSGGAQALLNSARAFQQDAPASSAQMTGVGLDADFLAHLGQHITDYETAITGKGDAQSQQGGATGGIEDATHKAAVALQVLRTVVPNVCKNNAQRLGEWAVASHVEKHTPVPRTQTPPAGTTPAAPKP
jgi:hypothetical protein